MHNVVRGEEDGNAPGAAGTKDADGGKEERNYYRNGSLKTTDASETYAVKRSLTVAGGDIFCLAPAAEKSTNDWIIKINRRPRTFLWNRDGNYYFCFAQNWLSRPAVTSGRNITVLVTSERGVPVRTRTLHNATLTRMIQGLRRHTGADLEGRRRPENGTNGGENACGSSSKIVWKPGIDKSTRSSFRFEVFVFHLIKITAILNKKNIINYICIDF